MKPNSDPTDSGASRPVLERLFPLYDPTDGQDYAVSTTEFCYTCGQALQQNNRREVYIEGGAFTTFICANDPLCADDDDIQLFQPVSVTCRGNIEWGNNPASEDGNIACGEEFYASRDKPVCPRCGCLYEFPPESEDTLESEVAR